MRTTNIAKGLPNSISVLAAAQVTNGATHAMRNLPSYYCHKIAYGPAVRAALAARGGDTDFLDMALEDVLAFVAEALGKRVGELVVVTMDRPRHEHTSARPGRVGSALRSSRTATSPPPWPRPCPTPGRTCTWAWAAPRKGCWRPRPSSAWAGTSSAHVVRSGAPSRTPDQVAAMVDPGDLERIFRADDLVVGDSALFCATGITDSSLLPGVKLIGHQAETHSILMRARSGTVRHIRAVHHLDRKAMPLREEFRKLTEG